LTICSQADGADVGLGGICLAVEDETEIDLSIDDRAADTVCARYVLLDADNERLDAGLFEDATSIALPAETATISVENGHASNEDPLATTLTDCPEQKATIGQVQATFR
jgi:hypothetical protein